MNGFGRVGRVTLHRGDALDAYADWPSPTAIISDGPYGIGGYPGDPRSPRLLRAAYAAHADAWANAATPSTTLWFWCTEVGWATVHPLLEETGWKYRGLNVWDKGVAHVAGNCNGKTMRKFPVVTEVCAHYVREPQFIIGGKEANLQDWFRSEWKRTGLPFSSANMACGVRNAASRKYLTGDHLWYAPPPDIFARLALYANQHGAVEGKPYFGLDDAERANEALAARKWEKFQARFNFEYGVTNVWSVPANRGGERLKDTQGAVVHANQKPLLLMERIVRASTNEGDIVWDPFCGTGAGSVAAARMGRNSYTAESNLTFADAADRRFQESGFVQA